MNEISFSFAGCGFLGIYHIGVGTCLQRHVPHLLKEAKFFGASAGAIISCCMMCDVPMNECVDFTLRLAKKAKSRSLGAFHPSVQIGEILRTALDEVLPPDAHEICTGRLFISVSHWLNFENKIISKFPSKNHLLDALMMSSFVPGFSGYVPLSYRGKWYIDGGLSDNLPVLDEHTILVSPFAGECDICPRDADPQMVSVTLANTSLQCSLHNLARLGGALFPPHSTQLKDMCWQGFDDALRYLSEHNLIRCPEHLLFSHLHHLERSQEVQCKVCKHHIRSARVDQLPASIAAMLDDHMKSESGLMYRVIHHGPLKYLCWLGLPCTLLLECWTSAMIYFASVISSTCKTVYQNREKISLQTAYELICQGLEFVLGSTLYSGPWCSGHPLPDGAEGEESDEEWDEADDNGSRKICEVCNKPQTYGARHRRRRRALLPAEVQEQPEAATAPARIAVAPEHDCLHEAITNIAESGSASVSGFATPLSGVSLSAAQHINFAFSVDFETQKDVSVEAGSATVSSQPKLDTIPERVEHFHVDNITLHPEVVVEEEESGEPVSFPTELMGDHVHIHAEETEPCPCPQALDTFQACLDVIHNMEVIMTLHYLDDQNKMHTETVYGVPAHPAPHVHHPQSAEPLVQEEDADNTASPNSTSAPVLPHLEENTWDSAIQHSAAVRHELMEIIEEKILQPELEVEERRRARCHHRPAEEGGVGHFSLQVGGSLGSENLASMMNSLNTTFSTSSMDRASQSSGANPHLIKSVSDASALAKKLQALKQSQSEAGSSAKGTGPVKESWSPAQPGQRTLGSHSLCHSLQSLAESEQRCVEPAFSFRRTSRLVKASSDGSGLASSLQMIKEQDKSLQHAASDNDLNVECGAVGGKPPAERSFVSEASIDADLSVLTPRQRRRMRGKFRDERLSRSQRSLDCSTANHPEGASHAEDIPDHNTPPTSSQSEPSLPTYGPHVESQVTSNFSTESSSSASSTSREEHPQASGESQPSYQEHLQASGESQPSYQEHPQASGESQPSYEEFSLSVLAEDVMSSEKGDSARESPKGARPKLVRSRSLQKCHEELSVLRCDLETLKLEDAEGESSPASEPQEECKEVLFSCSGPQDEGLHETEKKDEEKDRVEVSPEKRKGSYRKCKPS